MSDLTVQFECGTAFPERCIVSSKRKNSGVGELMITPHDSKARRKKLRSEKKRVEAPTQNENGEWKHPSKMLSIAVADTKKNNYSDTRLVDDVTDEENTKNIMKYTSEVIELVGAHGTFAQNGDSSQAKRNVTHRIMGNLFGHVNREPLPECVVHAVRAAYPSTKCVGFKDS